MEERYLVPSRQQVCEWAVREVLEVAAGSGLNLPHHPPKMKLIRMDLSEGIPQLAKRRATIVRCEAELPRTGGLRPPFGDESFDAVVCVLSPCGFPDPRAGVEEVVRVLRPGRSLLLTDHVRSANSFIRPGQWVLQVITILAEEEHWIWRPKQHIKALRLPIAETDRLYYDIVERFHALHEAR